MRLEDFATATEAARLDINAWASDQTAGLIPELFAPGVLDVDTRFVLTNAVYFNGAWAHVFDETQTRPAPFHALDGTTPDVPLMYLGYEKLPYAAGDGWQAVELPYSNPDLSLLVLVPDAGRFAEVEARLSSDLLAQVRAAESTYLVTLFLPKIEVKTRLDSLRLKLTALGMGRAFGNDADFSGIDGQRNLRLFDVVHQAVLKLDEQGTEAAAATGAVGGGTGSAGPPPPEVQLTVDRPYFLVLHDVPTGALLFLGRIARP